jgi:hypothetical protein
VWEAEAGVVGDRQSWRRPHRRSHWSEARHLSRGLSSIYVPICLPVSPIHLSPDIASVAPSGPLSFVQMVHTHVFLSNGTHTCVYTCTRRHTTQVLNMRACTHIHTHTHTGDDDGNGICRVLFCRHVRVGSNIGRHLRRWQRRVHCGGLRPRRRLPPIAGFCLTLSTPCFLPLVPLPPCPLAGCVGASLSSQGARERDVQKWRDDKNKQRRRRRTGPRTWPCGECRRFWAPCLDPASRGRCWRGSGTSMAVTTILTPVTLP